MVHEGFRRNWRTRRNLYIFQCLRQDLFALCLTDESSGQTWDETLAIRNNKILVRSNKARVASGMLRSSYRFAWSTSLLLFSCVIKLLQLLIATMYKKLKCHLIFEFLIKTVAHVNLRAEIFGLYLPSHSLLNKNE